MAEQGIPLAAREEGDLGPDSSGLVIWAIPTGSDQDQQRSRLRLEGMRRDTWTVEEGNDQLKVQDQLWG